MKRKLSSILIIIFSLFIYISTPFVCYASGSGTSGQTEIIGKLFDYLASLSGACSRFPDRISSIPSNIKQSCINYIENLFLEGDGLYQDDDGNYVFTNEALYGLYDILSGDSSHDARVVSSFTNNLFYGDAYVNNTFNDNLLSALTFVREHYSNVGYSVFSTQFQNGSHTYTYVSFIANHSVVNNGGDLGFLSFSKINNTQYAINLYNTNAVVAGFPYGYIRCDYNSSNATYSFTSSGFNFSSGLNTSTALTGTTTRVTFTNNGDNPVIFADSSAVDSAYIGFPIFRGLVPLSGTVLKPESKIFCYSSDSLILAKDVSSGNGLMNQSSNIFYNSISTDNDTLVINKEILNNNNWNSIYNNYITNVNNEYQDQGGNLSAKDLRKIMKKYTDSIIEAINSGIGNLEDVISATNVLLHNIDVSVKNIYILLQQSSGSGSGSVDLSTIESRLNNIYQVSNATLTNTNYLSYLISINTYLQQIANRRPFTSPDQIKDDLDVLLDTDILEKMLSFKDIVAYTLQAVVPLCYIGALVALVNSLASQPSAPYFDIPFKVDSLNVNEHIVIDLSGESWQPLHNILNSLFVITFVIFLIFVTFKLVKFYLYLFS